MTKYGPKAVGLGLNIYAWPLPRAAASKALDIFCTPRGGKVKSHQKKFLKKWDVKMVPHGNIEIATYRYAGDGPRVLLCHGWESNTFRWRKLFKHLVAAGYDVVAMDAPAHGQTGSDRFTAVKYAEMMDTVSKHYLPAAICGHSVGGMAAIFYLYRQQPPNIRQAIILAAPDRLQDITTNYFNIIGGSQRLRTYYEGMIEERFGNKTEYFSAASFASTLDIPALIVHDRKDTINQYEEGLRIHEAWAGSELLSTEGLDHSLQGEVVYKKVIESLASLKT